MTQFVNNFLINFNITNILYILASFIEIYLFLKLLLIIFDVKSTVKQKLIFIVVVVPMSKILSYFIPSPFNVILNYTFIAFLITAIFKLSILKSFTSLIISLFIFGVFKCSFTESILNTFRHFSRRIFKCTSIQTALFNYSIFSTNFNNYFSNQI